MKRLFFIILLLFCVEASPQQIVSDVKGNIIKSAIKAIRAATKEIDVENLEKGAETLITVNKVLDETTKYMDMLETVSESVKAVSDFKDILDQQTKILKNYEFGLKKIVRSQFLNREERLAYRKMQEHYLKDCTAILKDVKMLLANKKLKMFDGDRIILLNKKFQEIAKIANASLYTNEVFLSHINRAASDYATLKRIEKWENDYYGTQNSSNNW